MYCPRSCSPGISNSLLVQSPPAAEEADDEGHADTSDGDGKCCLDSGHVSDEDSGDLIGREDVADGGGAGADDGEGVDARGEVGEEGVDEGGLCC